MGPGTIPAEVILALGIVDDIGEVDSDLILLALLAQHGAVSLLFGGSCGRSLPCSQYRHFDRNSPDIFGDK